MIKNFMIQTGDPTGTGSGGESAFGKPFEDEIRSQYSHEGRGVLSMANSGANSNKSQFFITFRSCKHLDKKHTIFGKVVGGLEVLDKMERIKTDNKDKPLEEIKIIRTAIFVDPFQEIEDQINKEREELAKEEKERIAKTEKSKKAPMRQIRGGVGSFIDLNVVGVGKSSELEDNESSAPKKKKLNTGNTGHVGTSRGFGNFNNW